MRWLLTLPALPFAILWGAVMGVRNRLYDLGILQIHDAGAPVISVGNLTVGGTGKTPFVVHLVERLERLKGARKWRVGVVSRGYRGKAAGTLQVSDGRSVKANPQAAGDEPVLIAESAPGAVVVVDRDRVRGARWAVSEGRARVLILDDGFQHRRLKRDLDLVLLDAQNPLGNRLVLPAGRLRESVGALQRADLVVLSKAVGTTEELTGRAERLERLLGRPVVVSSWKSGYWRRFGFAELHAAEVVAGKRVLAFAGIASPKSFFRDVRELGAEIVDAIPLPDHCRYTKRRLDLIGGRFVKSGAEWLVTTAKDTVKLPGIVRFLPVYHLDTSLEIVVGGDRLDDALRAAIGDLLPGGAKAVPTE